MTVSPSDVLSSCEAQGVQAQWWRRRRRRVWERGARLLRVAGVEAAESLQAIDASGVLPGRAVVFRPLHQALELFPAAEEARVQDVVHVLIFAVGLDWRGRWLALAGGRVVGSMLQQRHVEHRVHLHRFGEAESDGVWRVEAGSATTLNGTTWRRFSYRDGRRVTMLRAFGQTWSPGRKRGAGSGDDVSFDITRTPALIAFLRRMDLGYVHDGCATDGPETDNLDVGPIA